MRKQVRAFLRVKLNAFNVFLILAVLLSLSSANNTTINPISNTTFTNGPYGTISINPKTLSTPCPIGSGFLGFSFLLGLPGVFDARKNPTGSLSYKDYSFRKTAINSVFSIVTILRCVVHSTAAILALRRPPQYLRLSDALIPLGLTAMLYWERAADRRNILFLVTCHSPSSFSAYPLSTSGSQKSCIPAARHVCTRTCPARTAFPCLCVRFSSLCPFTVQIIRLRHRTCAARPRLSKMISVYTERRSFCLSHSRRRSKATG